MTAGAIIAGGLSSRMQAGGVAGDKFLQMLGARPVIAHVAARLRPQVDRLFVNANGDPARLAALGLPVVPDRACAKGGPLVGLWTAMLAARDHALLAGFPADTPFTPADFVARLVRRQVETQAPIVLARSRGALHPVASLWRTDLADTVGRWLDGPEKASIVGFAERIGFATVDFPDAALPESGETYDPFLNINHPEDLAEARRLAALLGP